MGIPASLILIAVGGVLAFAVNQGPNAAVDVDVVGWILIAVGFFGILMSLFWWERFGPGYWGWHRAAYPPEGAYPPGRGRYPRRRTVVEEDAPAPPLGPPPP
jgi:hypothetical protein